MTLSLLKNIIKMSTAHLNGDKTIKMSSDLPKQTTTFGITLPVRLLKIMARILQGNGNNGTNNLERKETTNLMIEKNTEHIALQQKQLTKSDGSDEEKRKETTNLIIEKITEHIAIQ